MNVINDPYRWLTGYTERTEGPIAGTQSAAYSLNELAARGFLDRDQVARTLITAGLRDFSWRVTWPTLEPTPDSDIDDRVLGADGYVVFIHGWTGTHRIWEDLPGVVLAHNPRLVSLVVDCNGFGDSQFVENIPSFDQCNPHALVHVIEDWFDMLRLRRQPGEVRPKTVNFVGHSMGGAALFFATESRWRFGEQTRLAIAPALLLDDQTNRTFFQALGLGIGLVGRIRLLEIIDDFVSPSVLEALTDGATEHVRAEHGRVYESTPKGVTARVLAAMGIIKEHPQAHSWDLMQVILGHNDRLVALVPMLDLLDELKFDVDQIKVVLGTHYLFSVGESHQRTHEQNRRIVLDDILALHDRALLRQRKGV